MHTIVHTELRATCKHIKLTLRQRSKPGDTRLRGFHHNPGSRALGGARNVNGQSPKAISGVGQDSNGQELDNDPSRSKDSTESPAQEEAAQGGPFTPGGPFPPGAFPPGTPGSFPSGAIPGQDGDALGFYGSAVRRRLRMRRQSEDQERERPPFRAPAWFVDNNIQSFGIGRLKPNYKSDIAQFDWATKQIVSGGNDPPSTRPPPQKLQDSAQTSASTSEAEDQNPYRYYINRAQYDELHSTFRGLLQGFKNKEMDENQVYTLRSHLLLHYTGRDGDLYMDSLVECLARQYGCNLVAIDAQDIADLVSSAASGSDISDQARMLSYDVFTQMYDQSSSSESGISEDIEDEDEDEDDEDPLGSFDDSSPPTHFGVPVVVPRFASFGRGKSSDKSGNTLDAREFLSMLDGSKAKDKAEELARIMSGAVDGLTSEMQKKRNQGSEHWDEMKQIAAFHNVPVNATIIHIKNLKALQQTSIGGAFLQELYSNVGRRRASGECIMLVGTDSTYDDHTLFDRDRIDELQSGSGPQISQNIVLTPVTPDKKAELAFHTDRKTRIATINLRHLWTMLRARNPELVSKLQPGFWARPLSLQLVPYSDLAALRHKLWTFSLTHRLGSYIAGSMRDPIGPSQLVIGLAIERLKESDRSKTHWVETVRKKAAESEHGSTDESAVKNRIQKIKSRATSHEKKLLSGVIEPKNIRTTFNDVHVPVETIDALQTLTTLSLIRPEAFRYGVLASDRISGLLLYGPPGTGKTLLAKAVAKESGATVLEVSAADLNNMYVGEGEKNVKALFSLARKLSPCVVFLDEADAMFSARAQQGRRVSHREMINQFLKEWDGMNNDAGSAFIMVATNRPMDLDDAVLRRLPRRLLVDLPTESDRLEILKIHLRSERLAEDVDLAKIAKKTPFHSGSDLKNLAVAAALRCVREENDLAKQHNEKEPDEPYQYAEIRVLTAAHFEKATEEITASISEDMDSLRDIKKFDEQYGDKRGKKRKSPKWGFKTEKEANEVLDTLKVRS